ncbi:EboA domain-containing protein [Chitinophaga pendula]|uniref:EboA domain-containing protein n=1 Tax=Chitinophaga TaxID=79328 RepID=UPI000BB025BB|nr:MULTISPECIES: EboA domain-containing protein [Chitinophaga]ASZ09775.1 hypothetical protein CK934_01665 [Chitinophaga sp. MD30]UCJ07285.1 EboA domain-containing protein [Chitinophaga pendula]
MENAYHYDKEKVEALLWDVIQQQSTDNGLAWLQQRTANWKTTAAVQQFNLTFTAIPRFLSKNEITVSPETATALRHLIDGYTIHGYTLDRLARVWWLLQLPADDRKTYTQTIENLFDAAEMNELVALYGALPLLAWPEAWRLRTAEGIRSNIGIVLQAIMTDNPYPARYLEEPAWNQLVMKAFFTEKPIHQISGLDKRANQPLAATLTDYAHERWAAGRPVHPQLWRLVAPFINDNNWPDIQRIWQSENSIEKEAAALACAMSPYEPAHTLLHQDKALQQEIKDGTLTWDALAPRC